uniref:BAAT/Acyl-CoA thioester hydrolase C-terminal domain-containing protein n=1 Tax=Cyanistes caeruleus TaxID=156563 RepID=A0A8C0US78_CYACU
MLLHPSFSKGVKCALPWLPSCRTSWLLLPQWETFPLIKKPHTLILYEHKAKATNSKCLGYSDVLDDPFQAPGNQSLIPLEKAEAQFLFVLGQDDHVVKSEHYATEVCKLLQAQGKENFQILSYPGTGHCIDPPFFPLYRIGSHLVFHKRAVLGGELRVYSKAQVHAWSQIQAFFKNLKKNQKKPPKNPKNNHEEIHSK